MAHNNMYTVDTIHVTFHLLMVNSIRIFSFGKERSQTCPKTQAVCTHSQQSIFCIKYILQQPLNQCYPHLL